MAAINEEQVINEQDHQEIAETNNKIKQYLNLDEPELLHKPDWYLSGVCIQHQCLYAARAGRLCIELNWLPSELELQRIESVFKLKLNLFSQTSRTTGLFSFKVL